MREVSIGVIFDRAMGRMTRMLFKPFSIKRWCKLLFIAMFAGALFSCNANFNGPGSGNDDQKNTQTQSTSVEASSDSAQTESASAASVPGALSKPKGPESSDGKIPPWAWGLGAALSVIFLLFVVLFTWINSHFKFIWFHAIATGDPSIVEPYHRHRIQGKSLFRASLGIGAALLALTALIVGGAVLLANNAGAFKTGFTFSAGFFMTVILVPGLVLLGLFIAAAVLGTLIEHFVVPVMALDKISFKPALKKVWFTALAQKKELWIFLGMLIACGIIAGILGVLALIAMVLLILLAGLLIFGLGYALLVLALKAMPVFVAYCVLLGIPFAVLAFLLLFLVSVPASVFFRGFSIEFLWALNCGYSDASFEAYEKEKSTERSKAFLWGPVLGGSLLFLIFLLGFMAAIAVPNFIQARDKARQASFAKNAQRLPAPAVEAIQ